MGWQWRGYRYARELSMAAGTGPVCFEAAELAWLGFQPLEAVFAAAGVIIVVLAWRAPGRGHGPGAGRKGPPIGTIGRFASQAGLVTIRYGK
jgi:hypothetical protein